MEKKRILGIDLGTSNCALATVSGDTMDTLGIAQLLEAGRTGELTGFPAALYFPFSGQFPPGSLKLPWSRTEPGFVAGRLARQMGAQAPERLVTSAKSWLSYRSVDPGKPTLPWAAAPNEKRVSALEASRLYLEHLISAFRHKTGITNPEEVAFQAVLTVPASFDEVARKLTVQAARDAGLGEDVLLLEEPQAAFHAWAESAGGAWREQIHPGDLVLVCDVGGGTTDFSLIAAGESGGELALERISVGRHILLGGDNMDLALAYTLRGRLEEEGKSLDDWQFLALVEAARGAKEQLLEKPELDEVPITVPSRGSGLFAGTVATKMERSRLQAVVLEGFFAKTDASDRPETGPATGLRELGLPYEHDAVISRHLASFLAKSLESVESSDTLRSLVLEAGRPGRVADGLLLPDKVLFNGGVFRAAILRERVLELLAAWGEGHQVSALEGADPDLAVARGAAIYGRNKVEGKGLRIRAGASRSYYIGLESTAPAIPGYVPPVKALCVVPQGMEEGSECVLEDKEFGLMTGRPVAFRFFSSSARAGDEHGTIVADAMKHLDETAQLEMTIPEAEGGEASMVPVKLHARLSELGTLDLWMQRVESTQRWELQFNVRTE